MNTTDLSKLRPEDFGPQHVPRMNRELEGAEAHEIVKYAAGLFGDTLTMACSFQDLVLLDLAYKIDPSVRVFTIDTGYLFHATEATMQRAKRRYPDLRLEVYRPLLTIGEQAARHGPRLHATDTESCCAMRKLEPMRRAMAGNRAWLTGIRRDQSPTRATVAPVAWDYKWEMVKFAPLCAWTTEDVRIYCAVHEVPYNPLMDRGYPSIGCAPCTQPSAAGDRSGRWAGQAKTECGLHDPVPPPPHDDRTAELIAATIHGEDR